MQGFLWLRCTFSHLEKPTVLRVTASTMRNRNNPVLQFNSISNDVSNHFGSRTESFPMNILFFQELNCILPNHTIFLLGVTSVSENFRRNRNGIGEGERLGDFGLKFLLSKSPYSTLFAYLAFKGLHM